MDTNIEMCRKAVEIQVAWEPMVGDFIYDLKNNYSAIVINHHPLTYTYAFELKNVHEFEENILYFNKLDDLVYCPRQDQLQDMVETNINYLMSRFTTCMTSFQDEYIEQFRSMEQLWLAFVMDELYQKKWDGEDWI